MPSIQLISQKTRLKTEFKEKFKQKFNIFTAGSLKDGLRNFSKMDIDLLLVDSLPVHLKSTSWLKSFIRQRKTSSGEIAIILIVDPEFVDKSWIQNNTKLISNCQVFWYNQNLFPDLELFLNALESSINFSIENINLVRFAALANYQIDTLKNFSGTFAGKVKNQKDFFSEPVSFLPETNSNQVFLNDIQTAFKADNCLLLKGQEGLESTKIAAYIHFLNYPDSRLQTVDLALIPGYLHKSFLFGTAQKNLPGFQYLDNGVIESLKKGVLILKNIHNLKWEVQNDLLLALKNNHILREDQKVLLKTKYIFINNMNIDKFVEKGLFRQDLFSVVAANTIHVPTLQQRKKDLPLVLENYHIWFQKRFNKNIEIPLEIKNHIINKSYPGQFEQFYSYLYSLFSLSENILTMDIIKCIDETALKSGKQGNSWETSSKIKKQTFEREPGFTDPSNFLFSNQAELVNIEYSLLDLEREYIKFILNKNFNNIAESSRILGITRKTLYDKLKKYNIHISIKSTG